MEQLYLQARLIETPSWADEPSDGFTRGPLEPFYEFNVIGSDLYKSTPDATEFISSDKDTSEAFRAFEPKMPEIREELHRRIEAFFNDPARTAEKMEDGSNSFPQKSRLSGEYYLGDRSYDIHCENDRAKEVYAYSLSILFHCLSHPDPDPRMDRWGRDYLGLEAYVSVNVGSPGTELEFAL